VLYRVLQEHLESFLARTEADETREPLPRFVVRELRAFLECGILAHGFCRVQCAECGQDELVAFSCKRRGSCPSSGARRMAETAAHLVDGVLPDVPYRQWVLSLPHRVRFLCAYDHELCVGVRRIFAHAVSGHYRRRAEKLGVAVPRTGAVVFEQRFDSALRLNLHFHGLWADGVFVCEPAQERADFFSLSQLVDADVAWVVRTIRTRVLRFLKSRGRLCEGAETAESEDPSTLEVLAAAAVQGRVPMGAQIGAYDPRVGRGTERGEPRRRGPLCAESEGFSLHAEARIGDGRRDRLEKLCRYAARPPLVDERLAFADDGKLVYSLKKKFRDGSTHVVLEPDTLIARLAALVPRPFKKLVTYHGVFAPAAGYRERVVPPAPEPAEASEAVEPAPSAETVLPVKPRKRRKHYAWAELLRRVFRIDVLLCPCGGRRKLLAAVTDRAAIVAILAHVGLGVQVPKIAPARAPPEREMMAE
jgi:hypothetical protein